jgi:FG-GAP repeat.
MRKFNLLTVLLAAALLFLPFQSTSSATSAPDSSTQVLPPTSPGWTFTGDQIRASLGYSWMTAGDVNGDGFDDLIVSAYSYDTPELTNAGRVYVFHGSETGLDPSTPDWMMDGEQVDAWLGHSVMGASDVNGDGFDDVLIGSPGYDLTAPATSNVGRAYLYLGSASGLSLTPNWTFSGTQSGQSTGIDVAGIGDVNGDGYYDFAVNAPGWDGATTTNEGIVYVFYGSATGPASTPDWTASSGQSNSSFGYNVSEAGDVNGDGYADLLVSAADYDNGTTDEGAAFAWYGSEDGFGEPGLPANADWMAESNQTVRYFSSFLGSAGDVNGDGYGDVVISSTEHDHPTADEGVVFLWYGSVEGINEGVPGNPDNADWLAESNASGFAFGTVNGIPGDINHDGFDDVIVGCQLGAPGIFVYFGSEQGPNLGVNGDMVNWDWHAAQPAIPGMLNAWFARQAGSAGDLNGDGVDDLVAPAHFYYEDVSNPLYRVGKIWAYYTTAGVINGTVTYTGPDNPLIEIGAHLVLNGPPETVDYQFSGSPYSLRGLVDGSYYIIATIDYDGSGGKPDPTDPVAFYDPDHDGVPNAVVISSGNRVHNIDFEIYGAVLYLPIVLK